MLKISESVYQLSLIDDTDPHPTTKKIQGFAKKEKGWRWGEGVSFEPSILNAAIALNLEAIRFGFFETDAFPGTDGSIMVTVYYGDQYLEFAVERDGQITFYHEQKNEEVSCEEGLSLKMARAKIGEFSKQWIGSEFSEKKTITSGTLDDSRLKPSYPETIQPSQLSVENVYFERVVMYASTCENITRTLRTTRRSSGVSRPKYYLPVAA
jgi:hypothetical protein